MRNREKERKIEREGEKQRESERESHPTLLSIHLFAAVEFTFFIPLPVILKVAPGCVPGLIFITTVPSSVRTSAVDPSSAWWRLISYFVVKNFSILKYFYAYHNRYLLIIYQSINILITTQSRILCSKKN